MVISGKFWEGISNIALQKIEHANFQNSNTVQYMV